MNAIILLSVISCGSISGYAGARTTMGLAYLGMGPKQLKWADKTGRPWYGLVPTLVVGLALGFINVSNEGRVVFGWFSNLTSLFTLFGWGTSKWIPVFDCRLAAYHFPVCLSHIRFRAAWKLQGRDASELPWKTWTWPYAAWFGLIMCIVLIIVQFFLAVWPLGGSPNAEDFFANYVSVLLILVLYIGAKFYYRGRRWVDISTIDLDYGRRFYIDSRDQEAGLKKGAARKTLGFIFN